MAIKINGTEIVSNSYELLNIANTNVTTDGAINNAIRNQGNVLRIYDSTGAEVRTLFCATPF